MAEVFGAGVPVVLPYYSNRGWHPDDKRTSHEIDREKGNNQVQHGVEGHTGWKCGQCAHESETPSVIYPRDADDIWQDKQLFWQEQCDVIFRDFDTAVAEHFPDHLPQNCTTCPVKPTMPPKPVRPYERV